MTVFLLNLSLMALWVASTGAFSYANSALGFLVGFVVLWWLQPLVGPTAYFRKLPLA
jgi:multicomponent Na+:H+ antiporter subunit E